MAKTQHITMSFITPSNIKESAETQQNYYCSKDFYTEMSQFFSSNASTAQLLNQHPLCNQPEEG